MRKHKQRRIFSLVLAFVVLLCISGLHAFAATVTQDGLEVTLVTDKAEYSANEQIKTTLTVKNNNDTAVENVNLETALPEGYALADKSENKKTVESVAAGESVSLEVTLTKKATPDEPSTDSKSSTNPVSGGNNGGSGTTTGGTTAGGTTSGAAVQTGQSGLVFAICLIALLLSLAAIWFFKTHGEIKNKNTVKRIISLVLCISVLSGTLFASGLPVFADESAISGKSLTISEEIKVGETKLTVSATVEYVKDEKAIEKPENTSVYIDNELYSYASNPDNITIDESGVQFYNNEILIALNDNVDDNILNEICNEAGAKVVGKNSLLNHYQLLLRQTYTYDEMNNLISSMSQKSGIKNVSLNLVCHFEPNYYPTSRPDIWSDKWEKAYYLDGENWGMAAIKAPEAWEYLDYMRDVNVGVYDINFDTDHPDLRNVIVNSKISTRNVNHGTHVAGIIGAEFENGLGVNGVCPKSKLSVIANPEEDTSSISDLKTILTYLVDKCKAKAINMSLGERPEILYAASVGELSAQSYINALSVEYEKVFKDIIEKSDNKEFVYCVCAGNECGYEYLKDEEAPYGYYVIETGGKYGKVLVKRGKTEEENQYRDVGITDILNIKNGKNTVLASWNPFSKFRDSTIKNRILTVGAIKNESARFSVNYSYASFSNIGSAVDVVAPGVAIQSTINHNQPVEENTDSTLPGYDEREGTSMAAPHVTGIAAMLFSLNPDIKADEVKRIICETADREVDGYKLVNAEAAVKAVMGTGTIGGKVVSAKDGSALSDVKITAYQKLKSGRFPVEFNTNDQGGFSKELISGNYEFDFEKDGYQTLTMDITVDKNVITLLQFNIELKPKTQSLTPPTWQKRNDDKIYFYIDPSLSAWEHMDTRMKNTAVYIYEYSYDNGISNKLEMYPWHSKQGKMVYEGDNIWSYDLLSHQIEIDPEKQYGLSFVYDWDSDHTRTSELIFNKDCLGDLVYMTGERTGINLDIDPSRFTVKWVNADNSLYAPPIYIDYSGTVVGEVYWKNRTPYNIFLEFLSSDAEININKALKYSGKTSINTLNDIAQELKLTEQEKQKAYQESGYNNFY